MSVSICPRSGGDLHISYFLACCVFGVGEDGEDSLAVLVARDCLGCDLDFATETCARVSDGVSAEPLWLRDSLAPSE